MDFKSDWYAADQRDIVNIDLMKREPFGLRHTADCGERIDMHAVQSARPSDHRASA